MPSPPDREPVPERSHKKGEEYQTRVRRLLAGNTLLGFRADLFGNAYDVTEEACAIGGVPFDFSLRLSDLDVARHVVYVECKYQREEDRKARVNGPFHTFLRRCGAALDGGRPDEAAAAVFLFACNVPPDGWRVYVKDRIGYLKAKAGWGAAGPPADRTVAAVAERTHLFSVSDRILGE